MGLSRTERAGPPVTWSAILIMSAMLVSCLGALTLLPSLILT